MEAKEHASGAESVTVESAPLLTPGLGAADRDF